MINFIPLLKPYCEVPIVFGIEILNSISNLGFILVALYILKHATNKHLKIVGILTLLLGIGSFAWHAARSVPTYYADTIPLAFLLIFLMYLIFKQCHKLLPIAGFLTIALTYTILEYFFALADPGLSEIYFAILIVFFWFIVWQFAVKNLHIKLLASAFCLFLVGYSIRQLDAFLCSSFLFTYGTHWMWHILCAGTIYFLYVYLQKSATLQPK